MMGFAERSRTVSDRRPTMAITRPLIAIVFSFCLHATVMLMESVPQPALLQRQESARGIDRPGALFVVSLGGGPADHTSSSRERESSLASIATTSDSTRTVHRDADKAAQETASLNRYYRMSELDVRPLASVQVEPDFPLAVNPGIKGVVIARLLVSRSGQVEKVLPLRATPAGLFEDAVVNAFTGARYTPGIRGGQAVPVQIDIEIEFSSEAPR